MRTLSELPVELLALAAAQEGLLSGRQCEEHDVGSHRRSRLVAQRRWVRLTRGVFDTNALPPRERGGPGVLDHRRRR